MERKLIKNIFTLFICLSPLQSIPNGVEFVGDDLKLSPSSFRKTYFFMETIAPSIDFSAVFCTITEFLETGVINKTQELHLSTIIENNRESLVSVDRAGYLKPGFYRLSFYTKDSLGNKTALNAKNIIHLERYHPGYHADIPCTFHIGHSKSLKEQLFCLAFYAGMLIIGAQCLNKTYQHIFTSAPKPATHDTNFLAQQNNPNSPHTSTTTTLSIYGAPATVPTVITNETHDGNITTLQNTTASWGKDKRREYMDYCQKPELNIKITAEQKQQFSKGCFAGGHTKFFKNLRFTGFNNNDLRQLTHQLLYIIPQFEAQYKRPH